MMYDVANDDVDVQYDDVGRIISLSLVMMMMLMMMLMYDDAANVDV